ncbi:hypothetical protein HYDPIDRAFT_32731 [Hydnomerulius pinastri MD-312]|uniref:Protein kinase domain-containing protein n=1 Tax=Hydnomerulius pinastri MD-312 TaxID=994086 RepID=A0A0C9W9D1_9AGAM|nr:hypothetical protein HYDPIDRAFT_32731 [Hydnomerulius pinastri MD-312]
MSGISTSASHITVPPPVHTGSKDVVFVQPSPTTMSTSPTQKERPEQKLEQTDTPMRPRGGLVPCPLIKPALLTVSLLSPFHLRTTWALGCKRELRTTTMAVSIQVFFEGNEDERPSCKTNRLSKILSGVKLTKASFKLKKKASPKAPIMLEPSVTHGDHSLTLAISAPSIPSSASTLTPQGEVLSQVTLAPASQEEIELMQGAGDAYHDPEVLDIRRQISVAEMITEFFVREREIMDIRSPIETNRWSQRSGTLTLTDVTLIGTCPSPLPTRQSRLRLTPFFSSAKRNATIDDFDVLQLLGAGGTGKVFRVVDRVSDKQLALKVIKKSHLGSAEAALVLSEQEAFVRTAGNGFTVQLAASFHDTANFYMALEYKSGGDLRERMAGGRRVPIDLAKFWSAQLVMGLYSLHSRRILHRDIKPANVLIDDNGHVVIADMGLAKIFVMEVPGAVSPYCLDGIIHQLSQAPYLASGVCGTAPYMAPEIWREEEYGFAVDFWALGMMIHDMLTGRTPWYSSDQSAMIDGICNAPLNCDEMPSSAEDLLNKMLVKEPGMRATYEEMISHPFFDGIDWEGIRNHIARPPSSAKDTKKAEESSPAPNVTVGRGERYTTSTDPLPQFSWMSPKMEKIRARPVIMKGAVSAFRKVSRFFKACKPHRSRGPRTVPEVSQPLSDGPTLVHQVEVPTLTMTLDNEVAWREGTPISVPNPTASTIGTHEPSPPTEVTQIEQNMVPGVVPQTSPRSLSKISVFFHNLGRSRPSNSGNLESAPSATASSPSTLVGSSLGSSSGLSRSCSKFRSWIHRLWNPIPTIHVLTDDERTPIE